MPHIGIVGMTRSGKTFLARQMVKQAALEGRRAIVLDPKGTAWEGAAHVETDGQRFLRICRANEECLLVADEAGMGLNRYDHSFDWLFTASAEWGHNAIFISQRGKQVNPNIRENIYQLALFKSGPKSAAEWAEEFGEKELLKAVSLEQYKYYWIDRFDGWAKLTLKLEKPVDVGRFVSL